MTILRELGARAVSSVAMLGQRLGAAAEAGLDCRLQSWPILAALG
jgi:hypothetical protein